MSDCARANRLPKRLAGTPGTYVVRSGQADQFGFFQEGLVHGQIKGGGWYSNRYQGWGRSREMRIRRHHRSKVEYLPYKYEKMVNVMVWYSDGARSKLRWTCVQYGSTGIAIGGMQYEVTGQTFGQSGAPPPVRKH